MWTDEKQEYHATVREFEEERPGQPTDNDEDEDTIWKITRTVAALIVAAFLCSIFVWLSMNSGKHTWRLPKLQYQAAARKPCMESPILPAPAQTQRCSFRREWRDLTRYEQKDYISAVLCLKDLYSNISTDPRMTAYDDFPWVYSRVGYTARNSASFLPWHRYFLKAYENTLRGRCGYQGSLPYWDWTLDSEALEKSPVFDPVYGFGGDGDFKQENVANHAGRCVVDGPFAGTNISYYDIEYRPHCLYRSFRDYEGNLGRMDGHDLSPEKIEHIINASETYEQFETLIETQVHDVIPFSVGGDLAAFTAPYDPLFFLHHVQIDRLWWLWQQRQPHRGLRSYGGLRHKHSPEKVRLTDWLHYKGLTRKVQVWDVMDIEGESLCYRY